MSNAQVTAFIEAESKITEDEVKMLELLRTKRQHGFTITDVYNLTVKDPTLTDKQRFNRRQQITRTLSNLYYGQIPNEEEGKAFKPSRADMVDRPEESTESFYLIRDTPAAPIERPSESKVRRLKEEVKKLKAERDAAISKAHEIWRMLEAATKPGKQEKRNETLEMLKSLAKPDTDPEYAHGEADRLVVELLDDPEIAQAYDKVEKWYA